MSLWDIFKNKNEVEKESFYSLRYDKDKSFTGISLKRDDRVWPIEEIKRIEETFARHGKEPITMGDLGWLKKINDLIQEIERKAK